VPFRSVGIDVIQSRACRYRKAEIIVKRRRNTTTPLDRTARSDYRPLAPVTILLRPTGLPYASIRSAQQGNRNRRALT